MPFKGQLLDKIRMDRIVKDVLQTIGPVGSGLKLDRSAMRRLMEPLPFEVRYERDLELYVETVHDGTQRVLVLDNELALYRTTVEDVVLRKSPTVKEMVSIRNAIKILSDKDVVICKRADTVRLLRDEFVAGLDLKFNRGDIDALSRDGKSALENEDADAVQDILACFYDLLEYQEMSGELHMDGHAIWGIRRPIESGASCFGPMVIFTPEAFLLKRVERPIHSENPEDAKTLRRIVLGASSADQEGPSVFDRLFEDVMRKNE